MNVSRATCPVARHALISTTERPLRGTGYAGNEVTGSYISELSLKFAPQVSPREVVLVIP